LDQIKKPCFIKNVTRHSSKDHVEESLSDQYLLFQTIIDGDLPNWVDISSIVCVSSVVSAVSATVDIDDMNVSFEEKFK